MVELTKAEGGIAQVGTPQRVALITLGCEKNTVDSEAIIGGLLREGAEILEDPERADTIILNTCGFIDHAKQESINAILEALDLKKQGLVKKVIVAGCLSERYRAELQAEMTDVDAFLGTQDFERVLAATFDKSSADFTGPKYNLLGERSLTTPRHYAYLKISEGCDNPCSFCAIPIMRGGHRSRSIEELEFEAMMLAGNGVKELVVIAQDSTCYGLDLYGKRNLAELLSRLARISGIEWIRLMYAYPAKFPMDLLDVMASEQKIVPYLDIPVQHASTEVLKSMRRGITRRKTEELLHQIREQVPGIALRTTLITGYPTETAKEFEELESFLYEIRFERLGVFTYSQEDGTTADVLGDPIPHAEKLRRQSRLLDIQNEIMEDFHHSLIGREIPVIIESRAEGCFIGRTMYDAPDIDHSISVVAERIDIGSIVMVQVTGVGEEMLEGQVVHTYETVV